MYVVMARPHTEWRRAVVCGYSLVGLLVVPLASVCVNHYPFHSNHTRILHER